MEPITATTAAAVPSLLFLGAVALAGFLAGLFLMMILGLKMRGAYQAAQTKAEFAQRERIAAEDKVHNLRQEKEAAREAMLKAQTQNEALQDKLAARQADLDEAKKTFKLEFENLAQKIFEEKTDQFKTQSAESLNNLLSPLKERLNDFQKKVDDSFSHHRAEQSTLKEHIRLMVDTHEKAKIQTEQLTRALTRDTKAQGDWGEMVLERILEDAGLVKGTHYTVQAGGLGMKHAETGQTIKPDVMVMLPEGKHLIIDSKVSLTNYERFCAAETADDSSAADEELKAFIKSVRRHVDDLEKRRYQDSAQAGTPDHVFMFMPIEGAYMLALQSDPSLHQYAWGKNVVLVGTSTLFSTLRTIGSLWRLADQNKHAQDIARTGAALYDKIVGFVDDMEKIGKQIGTVQRSYDGAMTKLSRGTGNILTRTENMKTMGLETTKKLPAHLLHPENSAPADADEDSAAQDVADQDAA